MKSTTFSIVGMHCASCVVRNERGLKKLSGVQSASVNFAMNNATVEYDESKVSEHDLHHVVEKNGYKVVAESSAHNHKQESEHEVHMLKLKSIGSIVLAAITVVLAMFNVEGLWSEIMQAALSTIVILAFGWEFHVAAAKQLKVFSADMNTLISLGTLAALVFSWWSWLGGDA